MQEEHIQPHTHLEIRFAAEDLIMDNNQHNKLRSNQVKNRGKHQTQAWYSSS